MSRIKKIKYSKKDISKLIVFPDKSSNKYSRGSSIIIAGSKKYPGAAILCSKSAERSGSGYTKLFTEESLVTNIAIASPSIPAAPFKDIEMHNNSSKKPLAYLIGPGFDPLGENDNLIINVLLSTSAPVIIDGGALASLCNKDVISTIHERASQGFDTIITPHEGEASKILDGDSSKNFINLAKSLEETTKCICVLKGPDTVVCDNKKIYLMDKGTSSLAKAGSGDVLAGILVGILCQNKIKSFDACVLAVNIHAVAAKIVSRELNSISLTPTDLIDAIPKAINSIL